MDVAGLWLQHGKAGIVWARFWPHGRTCESGCSSGPRGSSTVGFRLDGKRRIRRLFWVTLKVDTRQSTDDASAMHGR